MKNVSVLAIATLVIVIATIFYLRQIDDRPIPPVSIPSAPTASAPVNSTLSPVLPTSIPPSKLVNPVDDLQARVTKKQFGAYITPENSPVQPERFSGYHTGIDVEYADITDDVPVKAVTDGTVTFSQTVSGYGGVMIIRHQIEDQTMYGLYGHLKASSMLASGTSVSKGQHIGVLGTGKSSETDGERRHLHFALVKKDREVRGYVQNQSELSGWYNPLDYLP